MKSGFKMKGMDFGNSPVTKKGVDLTKKPNPKTKAAKVDHSKTLSTYLDSRGEIKGDYEMENKGDFNISNLHKDTKISLDKKKKANNKRSREANKQERIEDAKGL